jgi:H2-forming N5,N10-methylenetetrahydromethanopterin dehydrogenase-like enzyme
MLAGARSVGVEVEAAYVASARECAESLNLAGVEFIHEDARACDLSGGTVFYLYSPFTGSMLAEVLERLREESMLRPIKICTLGPCTCVIARERWVTARERPDPGQITVFES